MHICPVCKKYEFEEVLPYGSYKRCPVCGWYDDYFDEYAPHNNSESENEFSLVSSIFLYNKTGTTLVPYFDAIEILKERENDFSPEDYTVELDKMYEYIESLEKKAGKKRKYGVNYVEYLTYDEI